ncbi:hypothetical protein HHK36_021609 [Tetracentron sinense]|uniref:Transcription repressor n=1 Tax=Tetracentron sinense TaxID=13715 RepID=A0A834YXC0_TETSI|nr:hypothetical protein HHK36_021609 [Tetracentron sinense]
MESRFKQRISSMFRASFGSCRSRNVSDIIERPVFIAENRRDFHQIEPLSPKVPIFPSICRSRCSETMEVAGNDCSVIHKVLQRRKVSQRNLFFVLGDTEGRTCPPASPISPLNEFQEIKTKERKKKQKKNKNTHKKKSNRFSSSSAETNGNGGWFSSEEDIDDETETFFTSKSFFSDSSGGRNNRSSRRKISETRRRRAVRRNSEMGHCPFAIKGKVQESFALVKCSRDPHSDFRTSMVEMIIEKQIFAAEDLEQLLQCFLSLNSSHHHRIIVEVFSEIWEALFSNWS